MHHHVADAVVDLASPGGDGGVGVAGSDRIEDAGVVSDDAVHWIPVVEPHECDEQPQLEGEANEHGLNTGHIGGARQLVLHV